MANKADPHTLARRSRALVAVLSLVTLESHLRIVSAEDLIKPLLKTEHFDRDPGWDNSFNRVEASDPPTVTQDFGWSPGRIGGTVWKSTTPAWYGMPLKRTLSFKDAFSASGRIAGFTVIKNIKSMTHSKNTRYLLGYTNQVRIQQAS